MLIKVNTPKKPVKGDLNYVSKNRGDTIHDLNKNKYDKNFDLINWKKRKNKSVARSIREADRAFNRRVGTP